MPEDASLDDFLGGGDDQSDEDDGRHDSPTDSPDNNESDAPVDDEATDAPADAEAEPLEDGDHVSSGTVELATTTAAWSLDGAACSACGTVVEQRWRSDDGLVCPTCKEW
ncbi:hypothetical protein BRC91_03195 [Halobacteriales archaeon QS_4_62_28]|nr:MAG: hypothetical protein BRC91_03195 [Halobacteriales archaeon QS_4_62_28]